jgi:hypothetical protein
MRVEIKTVTPAMAEVFLQANDSNRKINTAQLEMIKRAMLGGEWALTHQGVALYDDGTLADGQHRLTAIIATGVPCKMPVFYGVEKVQKNIMAIDCGKMRSVMDSAQISGIHITPTQQSVVRGIEFGYIGRGPKISHSEMVALCDKYRKELNWLLDLTPTNASGVSISPVRVAVVRAVNLGADYEFVRAFIKALYTGEYSEPGLVGAIKLRAKLMSSSYSTSEYRHTAYNMTLNTIMKSWEGENVKRITAKELY